MRKEEYIKTIVYNGHMVNIGLDDAGQQFVLEYEKNGKLVEVGCGAYNPDYLYEIEAIFGSPTQCVSYGVGPCEQWLAHGYCHACKYNMFYQDKKG